MKEKVSTYPNWTREQVHQLIDSLGEEKAKEIAEGKVSIEFKEKVKKLFNKNGRRIPEGLQANVRNPNRDLYLEQPRLKSEEDFSARIHRLHECLNIDTQITGKHLQKEYEQLWKLIKDNKQIANLNKAVCLPIIVPQMLTNDLGSELELLLNGVANSYKKTFNDREFTNLRKGQLSGNVSVAKNSRQEKLVEKMKDGPVIGFYFPDALQGLSVEASREQMEQLPKEFILSGLDAIIAMIMYPDILARDYNTPGMDLSALQWQSAGYSLSFVSYGDRLSFGLYGDLSNALDDYSGGLFFLG
jgi:hypothetical protein